MTDNKINIELLNFFNEAFSGMSYFNDWAENPEIVPADKTHKKLLENYTISPEIYNYYNRVNMFEPFTQTEKYADVPLPIMRQNLKATPYNLKICNAYYYRPDFIFKLGGMFYNSPIYCEGKEIKTLLDLKPYFLEYAKGFNEGYTSFEEQKINFINPAFTDKNDSLKRVFEFITARPTRKKHYWGRLTFNQRKFTDKEILNAYEDGLLQGYYYKAWTIVFTLNDFFTPMFKELNQTIEQPQQTDEVEPKGIHYALSYILDCNANGTVSQMPIGSLKELESIGYKRISKAKGTIHKNTFYKKVNEIMNRKETDLNKEADLIAIAGNDWRSIVIELSENREALKDYLKAKEL